MRRLGLLLIIMATAMSGVASQASAESRIALVIGNGGYQSMPALANPPNDAGLIAAALREIGFEVLEHTDLDQLAMKRSIQEFGRRLEDAGEDTVGLFYFAGHGVQANGVNYLIPIAARIEREPDLEIEAIPLDWVLLQAESARNRMNILVLDACRDNPISRSVRSAQRGFTAVDAPRGTLIAYATSPGDVALDGTGRTSPYTEALAETIRQPGLVAETAFRTVRVKVMEATGERQVPWENSSLTGAFYFNPTEQTEVAALPAPEPQEQERPSTETTARGGPDPVELLFWDSIKEEDSPALYRSYLERYPDGIFATIARERLRELTRPAPTPAPAPAPDEEKEVAAAPVIAAPPKRFAPADLAGRWEGTFRCQQDTVGMALQLDPPSSGRVSGRFEFFPTGSAPSFQPGSFATAGSFDAASRRLRLDGGKWIDRSWGFQTHDLMGEVQADGAVIEGRILTPGCTEFRLRRAS
jgi:uncharacterized caspase-like protein